MKRKNVAITRPVGFEHYNDSEFQRNLHGEVESLRLLLESDFKNQRIIDLENRVRDNKRVIVNTMTENIFMLRFGFENR